MLWNAHFEAIWICRGHGAFTKCCNGGSKIRKVRKLYGLQAASFIDLVRQSVHQLIARLAKDHGGANGWPWVLDFLEVMTQISCAAFPSNKLHNLVWSLVMVIFLFDLNIQVWMKGAVDGYFPRWYLITGNVLMFHKQSLCFAWHGFGKNGKPSDLQGCQSRESIISMQIDQCSCLWRCNAKCTHGLLHNVRTSSYLFNSDGRWRTNQRRQSTKVQS